MRKNLSILAAMFLVGMVVACNTPAQRSAVPIMTSSPTDAMAFATDVMVTPIATLQPTLLPPRVLTICLGQEPQSLFLYQTVSQAERSVLQAIYDGPVDVFKDGYHPVILSQSPSLAGGTMVQMVVDVAAGSEMVDASGDTLLPGRLYRYNLCRILPG
jgi:hypothetical protein